VSKADANTVNKLLIKMYFYRGWATGVKKTRLLA